MKKLGLLALAALGACRLEAPQPPPAASPGADPAPPPGGRVRLFPDAVAVAPRNASLLGKGGATLIGKGGAKIKEIGQAARREIETFIGSQVFLGLRVNVLKDWSKDPEALKRMGYEVPETKKGRRRS